MPPKRTVGIIIGLVGAILLTIASILSNDSLRTVLAGIAAASFGGVAIVNYVGGRRETSNRTTVE